MATLHEIRETVPEEIPTQTYNALFLTRVFSKHFAGNLTDDEIKEQFEGCLKQEETKKGEGQSGSSGQTQKSYSSGSILTLDQEKLTIHPDVLADPRSKGEQLLDALLSILINVDPNTSYSVYEFYAEVLNTLIVLLSTQLHRTRLTENNHFLDILMGRFGDRADKIAATLLENFIAQKTPPSQSSSVVYSAYSYFFPARSNSLTDADALPVADRSLLLLLLLGTQAKQSLDGTHSPEGSLLWAEEYRNAFGNLRDHHGTVSEPDDKNTKLHYISFKDLFEIFCRSLAIEERMLLFYLILVENEPFRYLPILRMVYEAIEGKVNYSQVYILLIILLIFSQDETVTNHTWFTERPLLKSISLGGLVVLVLIRTLQLNLSHQKDVYFHTNCLAILANMSTSMLDIHAYVAQRIISLFELIAKRHQKIVSKTQAGELTTENNDIAVYEDLLCLVLEIINSVLTHRLKHNSQLVYALLLKRDVFAPFRLHSRFSEIISNVEQVINYFHARVAEANLKAPSTEEVLGLIEQSARTWPANRLKVLPDLKFQYEEEQDSHEFFVPYVWALVHRRTFVHWSENKAHILEEYGKMNEDGPEDQDNSPEKKDIYR
ncbi:hypothetical protein EC973_003799 [Apophysomyces ossiformis]|uniref:Dymeclin n=1 Tax=Apophysomyces ossiformis TaxID=679940 RepID=A0A8H7BVG9_9FUNG|nr:hypothetical protein EC973_003799 [Apophysomyces ossiformis]